MSRQHIITCIIGVAGMLATLSPAPAAALGTQEPGAAHADGVAKTGVSLYLNNASLRQVVARINTIAGTSYVVDGSSKRAKSATFTIEEKGMSISEVISWFEGAVRSKGLTIKNKGGKKVITDA